jgi:hypothetical protein
MRFAKCFLGSLGYREGVWRRRCLTPFCFLYWAVAIFGDIGDFTFKAAAAVQ